MGLCSGCGNPVIDGTCACPGVVEDLKEKVRVLELQLREEKAEHETFCKASDERATRAEEEVKMVRSLLRRSEMEEAKLTKDNARLQKSVEHCMKATQVEEHRTFKVEGCPLCEAARELGAQPQQSQKIETRCEGCGAKVPSVLCGQCWGPPEAR